MFPPFALAAFAENDLETSASLISIVGADGTVLWVNRRWRDSASEHGVAALPGCRYFGAISGPLRDVLESAFAEALETDSAYDLEYECSTPTERRYFHLRALPIGKQGLVLEHSLAAVGVADAPEHAANEAHYFSPAGIISQCSNCRRVHHPKSGAWHWVSAWVRHPPAQTSHGICPSCMGFYWRPKRSRIPHP